jgi:Mn-dependent DtxR family transcriptional regulator
VARPRKVTNEEVLDAIQELHKEGFESFNSSELGDRIGLSRPSVNRRLTELAEKGLIHWSKFRNAYGHRRYTVSILGEDMADA